MYLRHQSGSHHPIPVYWSDFDETLGAESRYAMSSGTGPTRKCPADYVLCTTETCVPTYVCGVDRGK